MTIAALERGASKGEQAREKIKKAARQLFGRYGIEQVTIRDIALAAGQKNAGSVNYYFGSKEDLVLEILDDVNFAHDRHISKLLDQLENSGQKITLRAILALMVDTSDPGNPDLMRVFIALQSQRRDQLHLRVPNRADTTLRRCMPYLRALLPKLDEHMLRQRLYFVIPYLWSFLATKEEGPTGAQFWQEFWADPSAYESLLDTAVAILRAPPSSATLSARKVYQDKLANSGKSA